MLVYVKVLVFLDLWGLLPLSHLLDLFWLLSSFANGLLEVVLENSGETLSSVCGLCAEAVQREVDAKRVEPNLASA